MRTRWPTPFALKALCGGIGLVVGLVGMVLDWRWLVWGAVGCLGTAFLLRFVPHHKS